MTIIRVKEVTLLAVSSILIPETIRALQKSSEGFRWGAVKLISHERPENLPEDIGFGYCPKIENIMDFNHYVFRDLTEHVETSHCLMIQHHGYVLNYWMWNDFWLDWDYIGAIWPLVPDTYIANNGEIVRNGNGGFSLRSKKIMDMPRFKDWELLQQRGWYNEDGNLTVYRRKEMLEEGIKYAPAEVSARFSYENPVEENNFGNIPTFGYHRNASPWMKRSGLHG